MQEKKKKITERWWVEMGNMLKAIKGLLKMFQMLWWIENWYGRLTVGCFPTAWVFYPSPTKADDPNWAPLPKNEVLLHKIKTTHPLKNEGQKHSKEWLLEMIHLCICFTYKTTLKKVDSYYTRLLVLTWSI